MTVTLPRSRKDLFLNYEAADIDRFSILLFHCNTFRWIASLAKCGEKDPLGLIISTLLEYMGNSGTVLFPLFNFDFCSKGFFDYRYTPSQMGVLTERSRLDSRFGRTSHPIYSFSVSGMHKKEFLELKNIGGYSNDSPFGLLHQMGGQIAVLDLPDQNSMTFYHYIEEANKAPYRYHKEFNGSYVDSNGVTDRRTFSLYVRNLEDGVETWLHPCEKTLWDKGFYKGDPQGSKSGLRSINSRDMYDFVSSIVKNNAEGMLYICNLDSGSN